MAHPQQQDQKCRQQNADLFFHRSPPVVEEQVGAVQAQGAYVFSHIARVLIRDQHSSVLGSVVPEKAYGIAVHHPLTGIHAVGIKAVNAVPRSFWPYRMKPWLG